VLLCRRNRLQPGGDASSAGQATTTAAQTECDAEAQERRQLSTLGVVYLLLLAVGVGLTLGLHSFLGLLSTTLVLGFSTAWQTAREKVLILRLCVCVCVCACGVCVRVRVRALTEWHARLTTESRATTHGSKGVRAGRPLLVSNDDPHCLHCHPKRHGTTLCQLVCPCPRTAR
jgi:hypothetical protein